MLEYSDSNFVSTAASVIQPMNRDGMFTLMIQEAVKKS